MTITMKQTKKYRSYDQYQLKALSDMICDDIDRLLATLGIEDYRMLDKMIVMSCPIHGGDNNSAFNLYHKGDTYCGNWKCRTHQCEEIFRPSIIGLIRGCLSKDKCGWNKNGDQMVSFADAVDFAIKFTNKNIKDLKVSKKQKEKNTFINTINYLNPTQTSSKPTICRHQVQQALQIPSQYFLSRNYLKETLVKYDVGECLNPNREMYNRAVVPIYDINHNTVVGCSGRSINGGWPKWKHNDGFKAEEHLYNFWYAKDIIKDNQTAILVESPGNVWRLEEAGIHNSLAIFGSSLKDKQKMLLDISGAMNIITIMDNDEAGRAAEANIFKKCHRTYNIKHIQIEEYSDLGEMSTQQVVDIIKPIIEKYSQCSY